MGMCFNLNNCEGNNSMHNDNEALRVIMMLLLVWSSSVMAMYVPPYMYVANFNGLNFCSFGS